MRDRDYFYFSICWQNILHASGSRFGRRFSSPPKHHATPCQPCLPSPAFFTHSCFCLLAIYREENFLLLPFCSFSRAEITARKAGSLLTPGHCSPRQPCPCPCPAEHAMPLPHLFIVFCRHVCLLGVPFHAHLSTGKEVTTRACPPWSSSSSFLVVGRHIGMYRLQAFYL